MKDVLEKLLAKQDLTAAEAEALVPKLATEATPAQIAAILIALRAKGETAEEMAGLARGMRKMAKRPNTNVPVVDTCGTGGDASGSFNISTTAALVLAGAGLKVAKHGNRGLSSKAGSADVLEALGLRIELDEADAGKAIDEFGFAFLMAPFYHAATKAVGGVRRELGVRTVFNLLGPLTSPALPFAQLIGVFSDDAAKRVADAAASLGGATFFVVHGSPGWDEATPCGPFVLHQAADGSVKTSRLDPQDFGIPRCRPEELAGGSPAENAELTRKILQGETGPRRNAVLLNSALALWAAGKAAGIAAGIPIAAAAIDSGAAWKNLEGLRAKFGR